MARCEVNGEQVTLDSWLGRRLIDFLREGLELIGTKEGCSEGECGACTVLIDGEPACSCLLLTDMIKEASIQTIEGVDRDLLDRLCAQAAMHGGVQCGFCMPGIAVMSAWVASGGGEQEPLTKLLEGNLCRCTGYAQIIRCIESAVAEARSEAGLQAVGEAR
jgi:carbon-monoxide dehydrogenase small subunit